MTDKDRKLIEKAEQLNYLDWDKAFAMSEEADSEEAKIKLKQIGIRLHCREEAIADRLNGYM